MEELANHLENICTLPPHPNEKTPRVVLRCASPPDPPNSTSQPPSLDKNEPLVLDQGPGQLKSMLKEAQANQRLLVLIWQSPGDAMSLQDTVCALAPGLRGLVFALADATEPRNALLAQRLGVCVLPTVHVYNGMKLHTALKGPSVQQCTSCLHACNTLQTEVTVAGEQDGQQEDGQQEDGQQEDDFEPPAGGAGKGVRQFAAGVGMLWGMLGVCAPISPPHTTPNIAQQDTFIPRCRACNVGAHGGLVKTGMHDVLVVGGIVKQMGMTTIASPSLHM